MFESDRLLLQEQEIHTLNTIRPRKTAGHLNNDQACEDESEDEDEDEESASEGPGAASSGGTRDERRGTSGSAVRGNSLRLATRH